MSLDINSQDWIVYRQHVMAELTRLNSSIEALSEKLDTFRQADIGRMQVEIAVLKVKAGVWGAIGGGILALGSILVQVLLRL